MDHLRRSATSANLLSPTSTDPLASSRSVVAVQPSAAELKRRVDEECSAADELEARLEVLGRDLAVLTGTQQHLRRKRAQAHDPLLKAIAAARAQLNAVLAEVASVDSQLAVDELRVKAFLTAQRSSAVCYTAAFEIRTETDSDRHLAEAVVAELEEARTMERKRKHAEEAAALAVAAAAERERIPPQTSTTANDASISKPPGTGVSKVASTAAPARRAVRQSGTTDQTKPAASSKSAGPRRSKASPSSVSLPSSPRSSGQVTQPPSPHAPVVGPKPPRSRPAGSIRPGVRRASQVKPKPPSPPVTAALSAVTEAGSSSSGVGVTSSVMEDAASSSLVTAEPGAPSPRRRRKSQGGTLTSSSLPEAELSPAAGPSSVDARRGSGLEPSPEPDDFDVSGLDPSPAAGVPPVLRYNHTAAFPSFLHQALVHYERGEDASAAPGALIVSPPSEAGIAVQRRTRSIAVERAATLLAQQQQLGADNAEYAALVARRVAGAADIELTRARCGQREYVGTNLAVSREGPLDALAEETPDVHYGPSFHSGLDHGISDVRQQARCQAAGSTESANRSTPRRRVHEHEPTVQERAARLQLPACARAGHARAADERRVDFLQHRFDRELNPTHRFLWGSTSQAHREADPPPVAIPTVETEQKPSPAAKVLAKYAAAAARALSTASPRLRPS